MRSCLTKERKTEQNKNIRNPNKPRARKPGMAVCDYNSSTQISGVCWSGSPAESASSRVSQRTGVQNTRWGVTKESALLGTHTCTQIHIQQIRKEVNMSDTCLSAGDGPLCKTNPHALPVLTFQVRKGELRTVE